MLGSDTSTESGYDISDDFDTCQPSVFSNVTEVNLVQSENAKSPILVKLDGKVILVSLLQLENAQSPILVKLDGKVILVSLSQ